MNRKRQGFTIVELVIVIAVTAILAAVLIPTFTSLLQRADRIADEQLLKNIFTFTITNVFSPDLGCAPQCRLEMMPWLRILLLFIQYLKTSVSKNTKKNLLHKKFSLPAGRENYKHIFIFYLLLVYLTRGILLCFGMTFYFILLEY